MHGPVGVQKARGVARRGRTAVADGRRRDDRSAGFDVVEAANADDAIEILEVRRDIAVVFTDIQMPGSMDGLKLARAVRGRWPPIKIVATSGLVDVGEKDLPEGGRFLAKPYSPERTRRVLRELIGARQI